jgi:sulfite exporter TauE/SafE/copper chaperone CopZ
MTCASCETRVAKALRQLPGVTSARVSSRKGAAQVTSNRPLADADVARVVAKAGYTVGTAVGAWVTRDRQTWRDVLTAVAIVAVAILAWQVLDLGRIGDAAGQLATSGNLVFVVLLGVAASLSTCMALVGGLVMGLSARYTELHPGATTRQLVRPQLMFNIGRVVGFALLGAAVGGIGEVISLSGWTLGLALIAVAVVMGLLGLKLTGLSPRLAAATFTLPGALAGLFHKDGARTYSDRGALVLGAASFFLPCGFTQAVQVYALSTGNALEAGLIMALFAVGTTPGLMSVGTLASLAQGPKAQRLFRYIGVAVLGFALLNLSGGLGLLTGGATLTSSAPITATTRSDNVTDDNGVQVARIVVDGGGYTPRDTVVYAGQPVRWVFDLQGWGCASTVNARNLGVPDILRLESGENTVTTTLPDPGRYPYSCGMGMFASTVTAITAPE